ncbi:MAG: NADH-quinone oxidoreductase subunit C [Spirochaetota bacterium]
MAREEELKDILAALGTVRDIEVKRERRLFANLTPGDLVSVVRALKDKGLFHLSLITGRDTGETLTAFYHINDGITTVTLRVAVTKNDPVVPSISDIYPGGIFYEKELESMFGFRVDGLEKGRRYPVMEDWPEGVYPLRKDFIPPTDPDLVKALPEEK